MNTSELLGNHEVERFIQELRDLECLAEQSRGLDTDVYRKLQSAENRITASFPEAEDRLGGDIQIIQEAKMQFRQNIRPWYFQSFLMRRATEKPLGYPGDYELLEGIYDNIPLSAGFGMYLDQLFLDDQLAVAVRHRKNWIREWLKSELRQVGKKDVDFKVLNIASGSCREWHELFSDVDYDHLHLTCIDFDQLALNYARRRLANRKRRSNLSYVRDNALRLAVGRNNEERFGKQDVIYSFGLYDYLSDKTLKRLLKTQYDLLKPEGRMTLTFKDKAKYDDKKHAWFCDWYFEQRSADDVFDLLQEIGIDQKCVSVDWEKTGTIVFFRITKEPVS